MNEPLSITLADIPGYIRLQFISNHIENELSNIPPDLLPDALRWRKITSLAGQGYLGRYPGYFFDGSVRNEDYLNKLLNMNIIAHDEILSDMNPNILSNGELNHNMNGKNVESVDGDYYLEGKINWNSKVINEEMNTSNSLNAKDLSLPHRLEIPKTENKIILSNNGYSVKTELIENTVFNLYPRGNNKGCFITIPLNSYITPLLCIYYYEIEITKGIENECDVVLGFIKDEIRNISHSSTSMIDMRGTDDRAVGWYGKNGYFTIWNDKRIERSSPRFGKGDTVGMGYNIFKDSFFITKNGLFICELSSVDKFLEKSFEGKKNVRGLIPSISLGSWCGINVNLGIEGQNFMFDVVNYVKSNKYSYIKQVKDSKIIPFSLPDKTLVQTDLDLGKYTDNLVLAYLKYCGYVDTVNAMQKDLNDLRRAGGEGEIRENDKKDNNKKENDKMLELCNLKKMVKKYILEDDFSKARKLLEGKYPGFFTTYRKVNFRLKVVKLIHMLTVEKMDILKCLKFATQLKNLFKEEDCQYYVDEISILFSYDDPRECEQYHKYYDENKIKIIHAIIMAINEQNCLPFISSLDLIILRTDQNLENMVDNIDNNKGPLLLNLLEDYIKF